MNVGDIVYINWEETPSPIMTVERIGYSMVDTVWFDRKNNLHRGCFSHNILNLYNGG